MGVRGGVSESMLIPPPLKVGREYLTLQLEKHLNTVFPSVGMFCTQT